METVSELENLGLSEKQSIGRVHGLLFANYSHNHATSTTKCHFVTQYYSGSDLKRIATLLSFYDGGLTFWRTSNDEKTSRDVSTVLHW